MSPDQHSALIHCNKCRRPLRWEAMKREKRAGKKTGNVICRNETECQNAVATAIDRRRLEADSRVIEIPRRP